jgi:hypothetical protein
MSDSDLHNEPHVSADELRAALAPKPSRRSPVLEHVMADAPAASPSWDWTAGFSDGELSELQDLRAAKADLETQVGDLHAAARQARTREQELRAALAELAAAGPFRRRRVMASLVERRFLEPR